MALVVGPVTPGYRICSVHPGSLDSSELTAFLGHKGEPWLSDIQTRWKYPDFSSYNITVVAYHTLSNQPPSLAAHVWIGLDGDTGLVGHVYTLPKHRNQGLATSLLETATELFFKEHRGSFLLLGTDNQSAGRLYRRLGFYPLSCEQESMNVMMARGVRPGYSPERAYLGNVNRRTIHIDFENEYFSSNGGICVIEPFSCRHWASSSMLLNAPHGFEGPKLPGLGIDTGVECERALLDAIVACEKGLIVCAVAVDPETRRVHAIGWKRLGNPGEEGKTKSEVYGAPSCAAAEHMLFDWIEDRVLLCNQGVLLDSEPMLQLAR